MIELRQVDSIVVLTLAAGRANALDYPMLEALEQATDSALAGSPRALVVTGADRAFCGGLALPSLIDLGRAPMRALMNQFRRAMQRLLEAPVPTVAAINGGAIAGGCVLALMCDYRIIAGDGPKGPPKIGLNESQLGIGLPAIVVEPVRHKLPASSFVPVALEGSLYDGPAAKALGLVDEVVAPSVLESRTLERAAALCTAGREAYAQIKRAWNQPMIDAIERTDTAVLDRWLDTWFSPEGQQRLRATVARLATK